MLRDCLTAQARASLTRSRVTLGKRSILVFIHLYIKANAIADSYRPDGSSLAGTRLRQSERGRETLRSVSSTYKGDRSRHRSRSPERSPNAPSNHGESTTRRHRSGSSRGRPCGSSRDDGSSASSYRTRSPLGDDRKLVSYADIDSPTNRVSPTSPEYSEFESRRSNLHIARSEYISMEGSDSTRHYEFAKEDFELGSIIRAPMHEEDINRTPRSYATSGMSEYQASHIRSHISHTPHGAVYSESRFLIVVEKFASRYTAIPLFTYQGTGLRYKEDRSEYVSIQDHRYPGTSKGEAPHSVLTEYLADSVKAMRPTSVAHLGAPVSRPYKLHVKYQGRLTDRDTKLLVKLYRGRP